jgi:hypothetical protein
MCDALSKLQQLLAPRSTSGYSAESSSYGSSSSRRDSGSVYNNSSSSSSSDSSGGTSGFTEGSYLTLLKLTAAANIGRDLEPTGLISEVSKTIYAVQLLGCTVAYHCRLSQHCTSYPESVTHQ